MGMLRRGMQVRAACGAVAKISGDRKTSVDTLARDYRRFDKQYGADLRWLLDSPGLTPAKEAMFEELLRQSLTEA